MQIDPETGLFIWDRESADAILVDLIGGYRRDACGHGVRIPICQDMIGKSSFPLHQLVFDSGMALIVLEDAFAWLDVHSPA